MTDGSEAPGAGEESVALPPGVDVLWGRRQPGRRGPKPAMSVAAIVSAAITVADSEGLEAISMARVASELGFTTMSLYRYVTSKDELLQLMWNDSSEGVHTVVLEGDDWRARLRNWALVQRQVLDLHPWITQMPMAAPPVAPNSLAFVELGLATLDDTDLADADKLRIIGLLSSYTLSEARMAHDAARAASTGGGSEGDGGGGGGGGGDGGGGPAWDFNSLLRVLVDAETYPRLHRIAWSPPLDERTEREEFLFGVERILDAVQVMIDGPRRTDA